MVKVSRSAAPGIPENPAVSLYISIILEDVDCGSLGGLPPPVFADSFLYSLNSFFSLFYHLTPLFFNFNPGSEVVSNRINFIGDLLPTLFYLCMVLRKLLLLRKFLLQN